MRFILSATAASEPEAAALSLTLEWFCLLELGDNVIDVPAVKSEAIMQHHQEADIPHFFFVGRVGCHFVPIIAPFDDRVMQAAAIACRIPGVASMRAIEGAKDLVIVEDVAAVCES